MKTFSWQRAVIKVGSALIAPDGQACSGEYIQPIARFIAQSVALGKEVILVSSGSVAAGRSHIPVAHLPSIAEKQAMAAIGQTRMMASWGQFFEFPCAQILLTYDDLRNRTRYVNVKNTLRELLANNVLPIVNENDTVAVNELKVGDNDNLAAYTALVAQADTLIICSDIDGLYSADPRKDTTAKLIPQVDLIDKSTYAIAGGAGTAVGTGGMRTKIEAADKCTQSGIQTLIVNGRKSQVFQYLLENKVPGTLFSARHSLKSARSLWLQHTLKTAGLITIDFGAAKALQDTGASLLPCGITQVQGTFKAGDAVGIVHEGKMVAKGLTIYNSREVEKLLGCSSDKIDQALGYSNGEAVVHRDDLVIVE